MRTIVRSKWHAIALVAALATIGAAVGSVVAPASADGREHGRTIQTTFCLGQHLFCLSAALDRQAAVAIRIWNLA